MEHQVIEVERRKADGKGAARKVRQGGKIPGVLYGHKQEPVTFTTNPHTLRKSLKVSGMGRNTVFTVKGLDRELKALLKDVQVDPVHRHVLHIDLVEVRDTDRITVDVPVELVGKPVGVTAGGVLQSVRRAIAVECSPISIPRLIQIDVSHLLMGQAIHISDVKFPEGTKSGYTGNFAIASVQAPRTEQVETQAAAEGAPAAGAAEGGAAAAEGEKKAEKGDKK